MSKNRCLIAATAICAALAALLAIGLGTMPSAAGTPPPAGSDNVVVSADVSIASRLGSETIHMTGSATISHSDAYEDNGAEVFDTQITVLSLSGSSVTGPVTASQSGTLDSLGQTRGTDAAPSQWPADSFFDVFVDIQIPGSPSTPITLHNKTGFHLVAQGISSWPPFGAAYNFVPPSITPSATPTGGNSPPGTPSCLNELRLQPELPAEICVTGISVTVSAGTPTPPVTGTPPTSTPTRTATRTPTMTWTPPVTKTPTFTPTPRPNGNADCLDGVNAIDATIILQAEAGLIDSVDCPYQANVNGDGRVDALDALLILQYVAGLIDSLPV